MNGQHSAKTSLAVIAATVSWCALADHVAAPGPVTCEGPFARNSGHGKVIGAFGKENVRFELVGGPEGEDLWATVIYANDPQRRLEILWKDSTELRNLEAVRISEEKTRWSGDHGVRIGMTLNQIEALNGKPFKIRDFQRDNGGDPKRSCA